MKRALIALVVLLLLGIGVWYISALSKQRQTSAPVATQNPTVQTPQFNDSSTVLAGSIEVLQGNGFRMTLSDGTSRDIELTATTTIQQFTATSTIPEPTSFNHLSVGEHLTVIGVPNSDKTFTATSVRAGTPLSCR